MQRLEIKEDNVIRGTYKYADPTDVDIHLYLDKGKYLIDGSDETSVTIHYGTGYLILIERLMLSANKHYVEFIDV